MMIKLPAFLKVWEKFTRKKSKSSTDPRSLNKDEVHHIQEDHKLWLESKGKEGYKADFSNCSLPSEARFVRVNYEGVSFRGAHLCSIVFENMNLTSADFRDADLRDTVFNDVEGLSSGQLAGSDVTGAKLGEDIQKFESLDIIKEASKNARKLFLAMLLGCVYAIITVATTTDARLITNSASSPLPIIGAEIPIVGFYWAAPLLLVSLYLYFHIYMQRLWERLAELPAVFPEGVPLDEKAYPWLLFGLVRKHFARLRDEQPPLSGVQVLLSSLLAWWVVPGVLLIFWLRFLPRHDWPGTGLHIILLGFTVWFGFLSHWLSAETLKGKKFKYRKPAWKKEITRGTIATVIFFLVSIGAINGTPKTFIPQALEKVAFGAFADLEDAEVSMRPPNLTGRDSTEIDLVKGANLRYMNLRYLNASEAFLVRADFTGSDLKGADLTNANLRSTVFDKSYLNGSNLTGADLSRATIRESNFKNTRLDNAILYNSEIRLVDFENASLQEVDLRRSIIEEVSFLNSDLYAADFREASLDYGMSDWRVSTMKWANVFGIYDANKSFLSNLPSGPPEGFLTWAIDSMGAVYVESEDARTQLLWQFWATLDSLQYVGFLLSSKGLLDSVQRDIASKTNPERGQ